METKEKNGKYKFELYLQKKQNYKIRLITPLISALFHNSYFSFVVLFVFVTPNNIKICMIQMIQNEENTHSNKTKKIKFSII